MDSNVRDYLQGIGKKGGSARAKALTPAQRRAIAKKAALTRWSRRSIARSARG